MFGNLWRRWLGQVLLGTKKRPITRRSLKACRLTLEEIEERIVPTAWTVGDDSDSLSDPQSLRYILTQVASGDSINFSSNAQDIILSTDTGNNSTGLVIDANVVIDGGGTVKIDGGGSNNGFSVFSIDTGITVTLTGLTITNGDADSGYDAGGGILNGGILTLSNSTIDNNTSSFGGGILNEGTLTVANCNFSNNSAATSGGGIYNDGTLTLDYSSMATNTAEYGGGIYAAGALTINNSTFNSNSAQYGGGVYSDQTVTISGSTFNSNTAVNSGGAIYDGGTLTLDTSTFANNSAAYGGGVVDLASLTSSNDTFANNSATDGGGIFNEGTLAVDNSTFAYNSATTYGGGIFNYNGTATLNGDIVVGNTSAGSTPDDVNGSALASASSDNLVGVDNTASLTNGGQGNQVGIAIAQVGLAPLNYYGGPTETMALLPGSPAIGTGTIGGPTDTDERGFARPNGTPGDVGAFQTTSLIVNSTSDADSSGLLTLRDAINIADADTVIGSPEPISFDPAVFATPLTIILDAGTLTLGGSSTVAPISIVGPSAGITISGNNTAAVFTVNSGVTAALTGLTISGGSGTNGGGINNAGALTISDSTFSKNSVTKYGGGINSTGSLTVSNSTFTENTAGSGGGIYNQGTLKANDDTFYENTAGTSGGGIYNGAQGSLSASDNSVYKNSATNAGGGLFTSGSALLNGNILIGNTNGVGVDDIDGNHLAASSTDNLLGIDNTGSLADGDQGNQVGVSLADADLDPNGLQNNGGPTETIALGRFSYALGMGITETAATTDQRGVDRPIGQPSDVGAFQYSTAPVVSGNPTGKTIDSGQNTTFSAAATSGDPVPTYVRWQISTDGGNSFFDLSDGGMYSGTATTTLTITGVISSLSGDEFRANFFNAANLSEASNAAMLTVDSGPSVTANPVNTTVEAGPANTTYFSAAAVGYPGPTVQWEVNSNDGNGFEPLSNNSIYSDVNTTTLTITSPTSAMNGYEYECAFSNTLSGNTSPSTANSTPATLTVEFGPTIASSPSNTTVNAGGNTSLSAGATEGNPTATSVQWQISTDGGATFANLNDNGIYSNVTSPTLTITGATASMDGDEYRAEFSNTNFPDAATSTPAILTVDSAGTVTANPLNETVYVGNTTSFTALASGNPLPNVQWQLSTDGGSTFTNLSNGGVYSNVTSTTLTITDAALISDGYQFRAVFSNTLFGAGSPSTTTSTAATLTVAPQPIALTPTALANWTVNEAGYSQTISASGGTGTFTFKVTSGTLPAGLTLNGKTGVISGKPRVVGTFNCIILATDAGGETGFHSYAIAINPAIAITSTTLAKWTVNAAGYSQTISTSGGTGPATFKVTAGTLPTGLSLNASTGIISGEPTVAKTFTFTITATDSVKATGSRAYLLTINPSLVFGNITTTAWTEGKSGFTGSLTIKSGTPSYTIAGTPTGLPAGLTAVLSGGVIKFTGTPTVPGTYSKCTIVVQDASGSQATKLFALTINPPITFTLAALPEYVLNQSYSENVTVMGGTGTVTLHVTLSPSLPTGLSLQFSAGEKSLTITGKTKVSATVKITVEAIDSTGAETAMIYTLTDA